MAGHILHKSAKTAMQKRGIRRYDLNPVHAGSALMHLPAAAEMDPTMPEAPYDGNMPSSG